MCCWPSFFWCQWVQLWPLYPVPLICCPSNHPHFSLSSCSCLPEHSLHSHSHYLTPCSLSHHCIILSAFLHSPWVPALPYTFLFFYCHCILQYASVFSLLYPLSSTPLLSLHLWKHRHTLLAAQSISHGVWQAPVTNSTILPALIKPLPTSFCNTQHCHPWQNLARRIYILLFRLRLYNFGNPIW